MEVLYQLSYEPVDPGELESPTSSMRMTRSTSLATGPSETNRKIPRLQGIFYFVEREGRVLTYGPVWINDHIKSFGPPGIEPGLHAPHACLLPVYYGPSFFSPLHHAIAFR